MISLLKFLEGPWEQVRGYLKEDLEHIQEALNRNWNAAFGSDGTLLSDAIQGDSTQATRYVANTGTNNAPKWDQVNLANGVKGRLDYNHLPAADPSTIIGRRDGATGGDYEALSVGDGLEITTGAELRSPIADATLITVDDETATLENSRHLVAGTNVTFDTATPGELEINVSAGASALDDLTDVTAPTPSDGDVLTFDSGSGDWVNAAPAAGVSALDDLTDVDTTGVADGDALVYDLGSSTWIPGAGGGGGTTISAGAMVLLAEKSASASTSLDFATRNAPGQSGAMFQSDYDDYLIEIVNLVLSTNSTNLNLRVSTTGGSSFDSSASYLWALNQTTTGFAGPTGATGQTAITVINSFATTANNSINGYLKAYAPLGSLYKQFIGQNSTLKTDGNFYISSITGRYGSTSAVNAFQLYPSSGTVTSGTVRIYGIAKGTSSGTPATITGNGLVLLEEHTASASATLDFTTRNVAGQSGATFATDYDEYEIHFDGVTVSSNGAAIGIRLSSNGGSSFDSAANYGWGGFAIAATATGALGSDGQTSITLFNSINSAAKMSGCGVYKLFNFNSTSLYKYLQGKSAYTDSSRTTQVLGAEYYGKYLVDSSAVNALRVIVSAGTFSGTIRIYGITKTGGATTAALDDLSDVDATSPASGDKLQYDGTSWINVPASTEVIAASDQDISSSTTLTDDNELRFDMDAAGVYTFEVLLIYSSPVGGGTPDLKFAFAGPATLTGQWVADMHITTSDANGTISEQSLTTTGTYGTAATPRVAHLRGWAYSTGGGTGASGLRFQWAQNTSNANATRRHAGSLIRWRKLA